MKNCRLVLPLTLLLFAVTPAHAVLIDFEDIAVGSGGDSAGNGASGDRISNGFLFDSSTNHNHLGNDVFLSFNGTTWLGFDDNGFTPGNNVVTMTQIGGSTFNLGTIEFTEFFNLNSTDLITVMGSGGQIKVIDLDNIADGAGAGNDFQTETFNWTNLTSVTFDAQTVSGDNWWAFDNINTSIPEPATLSLIGLGLMGLIGSRARRRNSSQ